MNILLISGICLVTAAQCLNAPKSQQNGDGEIRLYYVINKEEKLLFSGRPNIEERLIQNIQEEEQWIEEEEVSLVLKEEQHDEKEEKISEEYEEEESAEGEEVSLVLKEEQHDEKEEKISEEHEEEESVFDGFLKNLLPQASDKGLILDALEGLLPTRTDSGLFLDVYDRIKTRHEAPAHGRKHPGHHNSRRHNSPRFNGFPKMNGFKFPKFSFRG